MREIPNALKIILEERDKRWDTIPEDLVKLIYDIEERVQFDETRIEAPQKIRQALQLTLEKESLKGLTDGNEI